MSTNYDASSVGVPYARVKQVNIINLLNGPGGAPPTPAIALIQEMACQMADGSQASLGPMSLQPEIDFNLSGANLSTPIPLVDPVTAIPTGDFTNLAQVLACLHAVAIQNQQAVNP